MTRARRENGTPDEIEDPLGAGGSRGGERYILVIDEVDGVRTAQRSTLGLHYMIAMGRLAEASDRALSDTLADLTHEQHRRAGTLAVLGDWNKHDGSDDGAET